MLPKVAVGAWLCVAQAGLVFPAGADGRADTGPDFTKMTTQRRAEGKSNGTALLSWGGKDVNPLGPVVNRWPEPGSPDGES